MLLQCFMAMLLSFSAFALEYEIIEGEVDSKLAGDKIPYRAMIPQGMSGKIPVVYFLHGRDGSRQQFREVNGESLHAKKGKPFAIVSLTGKHQGHNTYWVNDASDPRFPWKDVVMNEMIPVIEKRHKLGGSKDKRMIAGISMGSHGAWQLALSTGKFRCVGAHSLVVRSFESMSQQFPGKFGGRKQFEERDPLSLLKKYPPGSRESEIFPVKSFWVDIGGKDDPDFVARARLVEKELKRIGLQPQDYLDIGKADPEGRHDYPYWKRHMPSYLDYYASCFGM